MDEQLQQKLTKLLPFLPSIEEHLHTDTKSYQGKAVFGFGTQSNFRFAIFVESLDFVWNSVSVSISMFSVRRKSE